MCDPAIPHVSFEPVLFFFGADLRPAVELRIRFYLGQFFLLAGLRAGVRLGLQLLLDPVVRAALEPCGVLIHPGRIGR
ncbi:MAG: hypothetical protein ACE5HD_01020 [Acidobacteriota bacterium]